MPFVEDKIGFTPLQAEPEAPKVPSLGEGIGAAFSLESDVVAAVDLMTRERFADDPRFTRERFKQRVDEDPRWFQQFPRQFDNVRSDAQYDARVARIKQEMKQRELLAASGTTGVLAAIAAGILSPVNFIPLVGTGSKGLRAVAEGLASGAAAGAIQSGVLQAAQETRPRDALLYDIGAGAVLGGLLGGAIGVLRPAERQALEKALETPELGEVRPGKAFIDPPEPAQSVPDEAIPEPGPTIPDAVVDGIVPRNRTVEVKEFPPPVLDGPVLPPRRPAVPPELRARLVNLSPPPGEERPFTPVAPQSVAPQAEAAPPSAPPPTLRDALVARQAPAPQPPESVVPVKAAATAAPDRPLLEIILDKPTEFPEATISTRMASTATEYDSTIEKAKAREEAVLARIEELKITREVALDAPPELLARADAEIARLEGEQVALLSQLDTFRAMGHEEMSPVDLWRLDFKTAFGREAQQPTGTVARGFFGADVTRVPTSFAKAVKDFRTAEDALDWVIANSSNGFNRRLAERLKTLIKHKVRIFSVQEGDTVMGNGLGERTSGLHISVPSPKGIYFSHIYLRSGRANEETLLHELVHAATTTQLRDDKAFRAEVDALRERVIAELSERQKPEKFASPKEALQWATADKKAAKLREAVKDIPEYWVMTADEFIAHALTNDTIQQVLGNIKVGPETVWSNFVKLVRKMLGLDKKYTTALDELLRLFEEARPTGQAKGRPGKLVELASEIPANAPRDVGKLKGIRGSDNTLPIEALSRFGGRITENPVVQAIQQEYSKTARWMMAQMSNAGLRMQEATRGLVSAKGGPIEQRLKTYYTGMANAVQSIDDNYAKYLYGAEAQPAVFRNTRAELRGALSKDRLSKTEFKTEISRALRQGENFRGPKEAAAAAEDIRKFMYEPTTKEALRVGLLKQEDIDNIIGDVAYLNRVYNTAAIELNKPRFIEILQRNFTAQMNEEFTAALRKFKETQAKQTDQVKFMEIDNIETVNELRDYYLKRIRFMESESPAIYDRMIELRDERRTARAEGRTADQMRIDDELKRLAEEGGVGVSSYGAELKRAKARLNALNRTVAVVEDRQQAKLRKIARAEELQRASLRTLLRKYDRLKKDFDRLSDAQLVKQLEKLREDLRKVVGTWERGEAQIKKELEGPMGGDLNKLLGIQDYQEKRLARIQAFIEKADNLDEAFVRNAIKREDLQGVFDDALAATNDLNSRRAVRNARLAKQADELDPQVARQRVQAFKDRIKARELDFRDRWRTRGADDIDLDKETADWNVHAKQIATQVTDKILGTFNKLPAMEILQGERGPELARALRISSDEIEEFLENDVETLMRAYVRTMSADIELMRSFGSVDGSDLLRRMHAEFDEALAGATSEEQKQRIVATRLRTDENIRAVISRLRKTYGIPENPYGAATRLARVFQNLNTLRFMGAVAIASVPDLARPIMKYGLTRTYRDAVVPMIRELKTFQIGAREAFLAGEALDVIMHTRAYQLMDIMDSFGRTSKFEQGLEFATSRIGMVALFDYWTSGMKQLTAVMANAETLENIRHLVTGEAGLRSLPEATEMLATAGIDGQLAGDIWALVSRSPGGGQRNGVWLPNTEDWLKPEVYGAAGLTEAQANEALRAYRAALAGQINDTIITPGVERPLWMDSRSLTLKLIAQFRSFSMSSTSKTLMAGLQQSDMAFLQGSVISLAMGMVSYYLWAVAQGGQAYDDMMNAGLDKWADEAIQRSGLQGVLAEVQRIAESLPATSDYATFSGEASTRRGGGDLLDALAGPTADLANRLARVASQADDPSASTAHTVRTLMPYQNVFYLRRLFDAVEEGAVDAFNLPERRK